MLSQRILAPHLTAEELSNLAADMTPEDLEHELSASQASVEAISRNIAIEEDNKKAPRAARNAAKKALKGTINNKKTFDALHAEKEKNAALVNAIVKRVKELTLAKNNELALQEQIKLLIEAKRNQAAVPPQEEPEEDDDFDSQPYLDLIACLNTRNTNPDLNDADKLLNDAGLALAQTFRYIETDHADTVLTQAKQILEDNTPENRNALLTSIQCEPERQHRTSHAPHAIIITFLSIAAIAAGIALLVTGVGGLIGAGLIAAGLLTFLAFGAPAIRSLVKQSEEERSLTHFGNQARHAADVTTKIGLFFHRQETIQPASEPDSPQNAATPSLI